MHSLQMTLPSQGDSYFIKGMGNTPGQGEVLTRPQTEVELGHRKGQGATTHNLETRVLEVGGVLGYLNSFLTSQDQALHCTRVLL